MKQQTLILRTIMATAGRCLALLLALAGTTVTASGAEIQSLVWEPGSDTPVLQVRMSGEGAYTTQVLEDGQRLRISFPDSSMGPALAEIQGLDKVKGVYPYLADNGTAVVVDLLMNEPGQLDVQKAEYGYRVVASSSAAPSSTAAVPAPATVAVAPKAEAPAPEQPAAAPAVDDRNSIEDIVYTKLPGDRIQITFKMTKPPVEPNAFTITNPARISLDFPNTRVGLEKKSLAVKEAAVTSVTAIEAEDRTRVVLSLIKPVAYSTSIEGNNFAVTVEAPVSAIAGAVEPKTTHFASTRKAGKFSLKGIDFRRGPQGDGKIIINLSDPAVGIDIREQAGEIMLDFLNTAAPAELQRRLDVVDFATPVQTIDTFVQGKNTRMIITPKGKYEHLAYQTGNVFTVSVKPVIEKPDEKKVDEFGYSGEKLSLNFQNIEARAALQVLADFTGLNFVVSDTVRGSLTLRLKDVPWDQALDLILDSKNLAMRRKGNVITVAPAPEVAAKEKANLEATKAVVELEPLVSELIQINYAKAEDIASLLKSIKAVTTASAQEHPVFGSAATGATVERSSSSNTLLSPRGQVTVDERTNSLLIQDTPGKIREVRQLIAKLDQPVRQVMIESRLVEATDNFSKSLGVRFGTKYTDTSPSGRGGAVSGTVSDSSSIVAAGTLSANSSGLNVNLPSPGIGTSVAGSIGITIAKVGSNGGLLNLELSALEQEGNGKVISSPRIITANQKKAVIEQGQERVFTTSVLGVGSVVTKKATLKLEVTPQITPDDRVNLEVNITKDNFTDAINGVLNIKDIKTQVLLDNGETVVIGGIYEQDKTDTITKVPFLGDLPLLGWLFKGKETKDNKTELLIFLTPRILSDNLSLR
ncbi:type IV pilus secretin PilQ [Sulfuricaulis limicola]|uniref:type IV pilus secretin PilQ n=1 Tax=Sulfuricaulis limicola TaxID=1620215 RepID=UPI001553D72F|nr:type IV pilus secretin PilQ [Sulfuricaulis limicola]